MTSHKKLTVVIILWIITTILYVYEVNKPKIVPWKNDTSHNQE